MEFRNLVNNIFGISDQDLFLRSQYEISKLWYVFELARQSILDIGVSMFLADPTLGIVPSGITTGVPGAWLKRD